MIEACKMCLRLATCIIYVHMHMWISCALLKDPLLIPLIWRMLCSGALRRGCLCSVCAYFNQLYMQT